MDSKVLSGGSASLRQIGGDLNSAVLQEVVGQLNAGVIPVFKRFRGVQDQWRHIVLGSWRYDAYIKNLRFWNINDFDFSGAQVSGNVTGFEVRHATPALFNLNQGTLPAGELIFQAGDFVVAPFPAGTALWADEFEAGVNCDAVVYTKNGRIPANSFLVASFHSAEVVVGTGTQFAVSAEIVPVDFIGTAFQGLEPPQNVLQNFRVKSRGRE